MNGIGIGVGVGVGAGIGAKYEINWVNTQAKTHRRWHTDHLLDGVMGWRAKDLPQARVMEYEDVIR
eukprot:7380798-Lingulodinium_polyedra.AAC.1